MSKTRPTKFIAGLFLLGLLVVVAFGSSRYTEIQRQKNPKPKEFVGTVSGSSVKGNGNGLVLYFKSVDGINIGTQTTCPAGWTEAIDGYGPHYISMVAYDWKLDGELQGFKDTPPDDPPPPPPPPPTGTPDGEPSPPITTPGGSPDGEPENPTEDPPSGELPPAITPSSPGADYPNNEEKPAETGERQGQESGEQTGGTSIWDGLVKQVYAAGFKNYFLSAIAFGSDDVCSLNSLHVVPMFQIYMSGLTEKVHTYSDACSIDPNTNIVTCNRCKVCRK